MGKLKALIILVIVFGGIYVAWEMVPPYINHYQFQDELDDIARRNSYMNRSDDDVRQTVIKKASDMGIPLKEEQITVNRMRAFCKKRRKQPLAGGEAEVSPR